MDKPKKKTKPPADIDEDKVRKLAERQWSNVQIGSFFDVDESTIRKRFPELLAKAREKGKGYLRDLQWQAASKGSNVMLIWLGKQYLGQKDKSEIDGGNNQIVMMSEVKKGDKPLRYNIGTPDTSKDTEHTE